MANQPGPGACRFGRDSGVLVHVILHGFEVMNLCIDNGIDDHSNAITTL